MADWAEAWPRSCQEIEARVQVGVIPKDEPHI